MFKAIVIGASAGGMHTLKDLLKMLPANFELPIIIVQHIAPSSDNYLVEFLNSHCKLNVKEADEKEIIKKGFVYLSPPNYHTLVEDDLSLSLSAEEKVNYSRPSIDVLFISASDAYKNNLIDPAQADEEAILNSQAKLMDTLKANTKIQFRRLKATKVGTKNSILYMHLIDEWRNMSLHLVNLYKSYRDFSDYQSNSK